MKKMSIVEIFGPTIQGEGIVIGSQTWFVRTGGCDYLCERCDSLHAVIPALMVQESTYQQLTSTELSQQLIERMGLRGEHKPTQWVTLSGGNPCMWKDLGDTIWDLSGALEPGSHITSNKEIVKNQWPIRFALETQGTLWQDWIPWCDVVTVSPKPPGMGEKFEPEKFDKFVRELRGSNKPPHPGFAVKVPVFDQRDLEFVANLLETWPVLEECMYISIGNINPPAPAKADGFSQTYYTQRQQQSQFVDQVMDSYRIILDEIFKDPRLRNVTVLPQLHTLLWGNEKGK